MPMIFQNPFADNSREFLVGNELGDSYKVVKEVYDKLPTLAAIQEDPKIDALYQNITSITNISENLEELLAIDEIVTPEVLEAIKDIPSALDTLNKLKESVKKDAKSSKDSADLSKQWATLLGGKVADEDFSSKHWANESRNSATVSTTAASKVAKGVDLAKRWATQELLPVEKDLYSAKHYAGKTQNDLKAIAKLKAEVSSLRDEVAEDTALAKESEEVAKTSAMYIINLVDPIKVWHKEVETNKGLVEDALVEVNSSKVEVINARNEVRKDLASNKAIKDEINTSKTIVTKAESNVKSLESTVSINTKEVATNTSLVRDLASQVTEDKKAVASNKELTTKAVEEATSAKNSANSFADEAKASAGKAKESETKAQQSATQASKDKVAVESLVQEATRIEGVLTPLEGYVREAEATIKEAEINVEANKNLVQANVVTVTEAKEFITNKASEVQKAKGEVDTVNTSIKQDKAEVNQAKETILEAKQAVTDMEERVTQVRDIVVPIEVSVKASEKVVAQKATEVSDSVGLARDWASKEHNSIVSDGEYSAKHYAEEAKGFASQASQGQVQADWREEERLSKAYIKNKPELGTFASKNRLTAEDIPASSIDVSKLGEDVLQKFTDPSLFEGLKADILEAINQAGVI